MYRSYVHRHALALVLALFINTAPCVAQSHYTAGRALQDLIEATNSGDSARIAALASARYDPAYLAQSGGVPRAVRRWLEIHETYGHLVVDTVLNRQPASANAWIIGSVSRSWLDYRIALDSVTNLVTGVGLGRGVRPAASMLRPKLADADLPSNLSEYLQALSNSSLFSGTVLVARGGSVLFEGAFGLANQERGSRHTTDTRFDLASVGKIFTAVAIAQLAEAGKLSLDDTVARFGLGLPAAITRRITVAQLLNHTSGLGELGPALDSAMRTTRTVPEMIRLLTDTTLMFVPGSSIQYSNRGYLILGAVIEAVTGQDYYQYIADHVFKLAGMSATRFLDDATPAPNRAVRYSRFPTLRSPYIPGPRQPTAARQDLRGGPAGGVYSTTRDLFRFVRAFEDGRLVSAGMRQRLITGAKDVPWGYGFDLIDGGGYGHRGAAPGATACLFYFPTGHTVAVLSNFDSAAQIVCNYIRERTGN